MNKFFEELKRRNVIKATIAYLVVAWIVVQVATAVLPTFDAPAWVTQAIIIILAIGLPIWIIISWIYDITPEGIAKTTEAPEKQIFKQIANKRLNVFIIVSLSIAVVVMGLKMSNLFEPSTDSKYFIAVMAFENVSNDEEQEYFSDGISEEIINMLSQVPGLTVMARTSSFSFKGKNQDAKSIGEQLGVSHILEGSVRKSGNKLRITTQLINTADGSQMFSRQFDEELKDIFDIQDEISMEILDAVKIELLGNRKEAVLKNYTENAEAYHQFLKGRYHYRKYTPEDFKKAIKYYKAAIAIDSEYAIAYAEMANCLWDSYYFEWLPKERSLPFAIQAANKAVLLDDQSAESHIALGRIMMWYEWDFAIALKQLEKGLKINPNSVEGNMQLGAWHMLTGNYEKGNIILEKTENLDPFSLLHLTYMAAYQFLAGDYEKMIEYGNKLIALEPNFHGGHNYLGMGLLYQQKYKEAITELELAVNLTYEQDMLSLQYLGLAYGLNGEKPKALNILKKMIDLQINQDKINYYTSLVYAGIGDLDAFFEIEEQGLIDQNPNILFSKPFYRDYFPELKDDARMFRLIGLIDSKIK
jgi:serine/threonine-protein kinase